MAMTATMLRLRAQTAAYAMHARHDVQEVSRPGREAFQRRFERQVDPDGTLPPAERARRAEAAKRAYMSGLAYKKAAKWAAAHPAPAAAPATAAPTKPLKEVCDWCLKEQGRKPPRGKYTGRICARHRDEWVASVTATAAAGSEAEAEAATKEATA